jgi:hypothetical protein
MGYGFSNGNAYFKTPHLKEFASGVYNEETGLVKFRNVSWYTNIDLLKRHEDLILYKTYYGNESEYPIYDNYKAINVNKVADIPVDYKGLMGVPITFIDKYNPEQFEIIGIDRVLVEEATGKVSRFRINDTEIYARIIIKNKRL